MEVPDNVWSPRAGGVDFGDSDGGWYAAGEQIGSIYSLVPRGRPGSAFVYTSMVTMDVTQNTTTACLARLCEGDSRAAEELFPLVYDELRAVAGAIFRRERMNHTLQPTAVVNEAYLRLIDQSQPRWNSRAHFCAVAARAMRHILIDYARRQQAEKRRAPTDPAPAVTDDSGFDGLDVLAIHEALDKLGELNERQARIVEMRFFGGMEIDEIASLLDVSPRTVKGEWRLARAWLQCRLDSERG